MKKKLTVGSEWETRCGGRAVVVKVVEDRICVWHEFLGDVLEHDFQGRVLEGFQGLPRQDHRDNNNDLVVKWVDPVEGEVWINVFEKDIGIELFEAQRTLGGAVDQQEFYEKRDYKTLARAKVIWKKGQFDE